MNDKYKGSRPPQRTPKPTISTQDVAEIKEMAKQVDALLPSDANGVFEKFVQQFLEMSSKRSETNR